MKLTTQKLKNLIQEELSEMMEPSEHDVYGTPEDYAQHEISMLDHNGKKLGLKMGPDSIEVFFIDPMDGVPHYVNKASSIEELIQILNMPQ
tara:strand:- start:278 stop:550 length:273 start_codon:yes stop_codon:yes gene_type:complete